MYLWGGCLEVVRLVLFIFWVLLLVKNLLVFLLIFVFFVMLCELLVFNIFEWNIYFDGGVLGINLLGL